MLSDTIPMVVGTKYLLLTTSSEGIINNIYHSLNDVENFINNIYHKLSVVILNDKDFETVKNKYIEDKKNNITYEIQEETGKLIEEENSLISQAISVFGSDLVDIE